MSSSSAPLVASKERGAIDKSETKETLKAWDRQRKEKEAFHRERIYFECEKKRFSLQRHQCTGEELQRRAPFTIAYLVEAKGGEVVHLDEARHKCGGAGKRYRLVPRRDRDVFDAADDVEFYEGTLALLVENVPVEVNGFRMRDVDLREWIMSGIQEEDERVSRYVSAVGDVEEEIEEIVRRMKLVPFMEIRRNNKLLDDAEADAERDARYSALLADKESMEKRLERSKERANKAIATRNRTKIVLTQQSDDNTTWFCSFLSNDAPRLETWAAHKTDWDGIRLALGGRDQDTGVVLPPWTGRKNAVPDGSKDYLPDYSRRAVNMQTVTLRRVEHGFGIEKHYNQFYHGQFDRGLRHGSALEYSEHGVFSGHFERGKKRGNRSRMDFANGDSYVGAFGATRPNRYGDGVFDGRGTMTFADGSVYEGEWKEGRIHGQGKYTSSSGDTLEGTFVDGRLDGPECTEELLHGSSVYVGAFEHGEYHGRGVLERDGRVYTGIFDQGFKSGRGVEEDIKGGRYEGFFFLDRRHGHGVQNGGFEGRWLLGHPRTLGKKGTTYAALPRHKKLLDSSWKERRRAQIDLDRQFRAEMCRKKSSVYKAMHRHAQNIVRKKNLDEEDYVETFSSEVDDNNPLRQNFINTNAQAPSEFSSEAAVASNPLSRTVQSHYEQVHELWSKIDPKSALDVARQNIVRNEILLNKN